MRSSALLLLIGLLFLYSLKSKFVALYTYWWFAIFRPHEWAWNDTLTNLHLPKIAALLFLGSALYHRKIPKIDNSITFLMILFLALEWLATFINGCSDSSAKHTFTIFDLSILLIVVLLTTEILEKKDKIAWLITVIALSIGFHSGKGGIHALITGGDYYGADNLTGLFSGSNSFALGTGILVFFMIFSMQFISEIKNETTNFLKLIIVKSYIFLMPILIFGSIYNIISLQSRGSFLAIIFSLLLWILLHEKAMRLLLISLVGVSLVYAIVPLPENYNDRIASIFADEEERDRSAESRPHYWNTAFEISKDHPLGIGTGCFKSYYSSYDSTGGLYGYNRSVHSSHFQILADIGYPGLFVWFSLFFISFRKLWAIRKASRKKLTNCESSRFYFYISNALICSITTFLLGGSFYEYAYNDIIWLTWGMVVALERLHSGENDGAKDIAELT